MGRREPAGRYPTLLINLLEVLKLSIDNLTSEYVEKMQKKVEDLDYRVNSMTSKVKERDRNEFERDYARVLYSSSFRRLQGKMQLLGIKNTNFFRNRLTHSLEVAQIARGVADTLGLETSRVVETCSLAHDLGNSPFGHYGEKVLNDIAIKQGIDGFEGNAQTLRILTTLEKKHHNYRGLNLTFRTLLGTVKYFNQFEINKDYELENRKFIYDSDYDLILESLKKNGLSEKDAESIDMQIMDLADEIAYAAHDLEDCLNIELFSINELLYEFKISEKYKDAYEEIYSIVERCKKFANRAEKLKTSEEYSALFRKELTSEIVNTLVNDVGYSHESNKLGFIDHKKLVSGLKDIVFDLLLKKPYVRKYEKNGEKVIRGLYKVYSDKDFNKDLSFLPPEFRNFETDKERKRNIIDFIAGMMDKFAIEEYKKYFGRSSLDKLYLEELKEEE